MVITAQLNLKIEDAQCVVVCVCACVHRCMCGCVPSWCSKELNTKEKEKVQERIRNK